MRRDLAVMARLIPQAQVRIALLGDGAPWVWNSLTAAFPTGCPILDDYHGKEHRYQVADVRDRDPVPAVHWVEASLARLGEDRLSHIIAGRRRMKPATQAARAAIDGLITYSRRIRVFGFYLPIIWKFSVRSVLSWGVNRSSSAKNVSHDSLNFANVS